MTVESMTFSTESEGSRRRKDGGPENKRKKRRMAIKVGRFNPTSNSLVPA
jgi:hypothetical protein